MTTPTDTPLPQPIPEPDAIPTPQDIAYPGGALSVRVDATDLHRRIYRVEQTIPVTGPGDITLLYPKWLPGYHSPQGQIELFAGLEIRAGAEKLAWTRDPVEVYAFHVEVPQGVDRLDLRFQFLTPTSTAQGSVLVTPDMLALHWNAVILYPAGYFARNIMVDAAVKLPEGWSFACALRGDRPEGGFHRFQRSPLDLVADSPLYAGRHVRQLPLDDSGSIRLNLIADRPECLSITDEQLDAHRALIAEADALFGSRPFEHYDFLVALSDELGASGVEHHQSCEIGADPTHFTAWNSQASKRDVFGHEYTHAWNGKYRRGADSWIASFERPIGNSLMWVYEGLTQYWGQVLTVRAGLWSPQDFRDAFAHTAAIYDNRAGRLWRTMADTTRDPIIAARATLPWPSWQRSEDYYSEGQLLWLEIDTLIRELTNDARSLDDFARLFFGGAGGRVMTMTYTLDDVTEALGQVAPYDWSDLIGRRLQSREPDAPLEGIRRGGYQLTYGDRITAFSGSADASAGLLSLLFSLGVIVSGDGTIQEVLWGSPAFDAGLTAGSELTHVGDRAYRPDLLTQAVTDAAGSGQPIALEIGNGSRRRSVRIPYTGGHRYPRLDRAEGPTRLDDILSPRR